MTEALCNCWQDEHWRGAPGCVTQTNTESQPTEDVKVDRDTLTEGCRISAVAAELMDTLIKKNADYAGGQEFLNFEGAAEFAGIEPFELILAQIGIKYTRIANLHGGDAPENESLRDSFVDLAGYAVIAAAWLDTVQDDQTDGEREECECCG